MSIPAPRIFSEIVIRKARNRYLLVALLFLTLLLYSVGTVLWSYNHWFQTLPFFILLGPLVIISLFRLFDRPKRLRRLLIDEPTRIRRGYIEYRVLPIIRRVRMTYLHLVDDQGRVHYLPGKVSILLNLVDEIRHLAPDIDWKSGPQAPTTDDI